MYKVYFSTFFPSASDTRTEPAIYDDLCEYLSVPARVKLISMLMAREREGGWGDRGEGCESGGGGEREEQEECEEGKEVDREGGYRKEGVKEENTEKKEQVRWMY